MPRVTAAPLVSHWEDMYLHKQFKCTTPPYANEIFRCWKIDMQEQNGPRVRICLQKVADPEYKIVAPLRRFQEEFVEHSELPIGAVAVSMNEYIIDTSITPTAPPPAGGFDADEMLQIGDLYRIPWHVRQNAAEASIAAFGYRWPDALTTLPDGVVVRVDNLYLSYAPRRRKISLRIEGQAARRTYWEARGNQYALERDPIPAAYIAIEYDAFMHMHRRIAMGAGLYRYVQIDLEQYHVGNDLTPALDPEP